MANYFFDLHENGNVLTDEEGALCSNIDEVRAFAIAAARDLISSEARNGILNMDCHILARDDQGAPVLTVLYREAVKIYG